MGVTADPLLLLAELDRATDRLLATAAGLDDAGVAAPSALPGWTRGHVLAHVARNADGMSNLLVWARTGVVTPQYAPGQRERDIAAGTPRGAAAQIADVRESAARYAAAAAKMSPPDWVVMLDLPAGPQPAAYGVWRRLREVEVHHVDLDAGYTTADWPESFTHRLLHEVCSGLSTRDDVPAVTVRPSETGHPLAIGSGGPVVAGPAYALAGWLTGRSAATGLTVSPDGPLPAVPAWM
jgi:maleylpyruvate isomerase